MTQEAVSRANRRLFERLAIMLNECPDFINAQMVGELKEKFGISEQEAFSLLLCAVLEFDTDYPPDRELWDEYSPHMVHHLNERDFLDDSFYKAIQVDRPERLNEWELTEQEIAPYTAFVCGDPITRPNGMVIPQIGFFDCAYRYPAVLQNGREWMTLLPNEIITQRVPIKKARGRVLTYGLGLGYFAYLTARKAEVESVTVVERDDSVISLFKRLILPKLNCDKINIIKSDAFDYAEHIAPFAGYNYIFADIWHDPTDGVELYKRFKTLELDKEAEYDYWIEDTLKLYM